MSRALSGVEIIRLNGDPVAWVVDGESYVTRGLSESAELTIKGMCMFALEVQARAIDPPYTDKRALAYARLADAQRARGAGAR